MREHRQVNWERLRSRMEESRGRMDRSLDPDAERVRAIFLERAARLARLSESPAAQGETSVLVFRLGGERWGVELGSLSEVLPQARCTPVPGAPAELAGVAQVRGELLPVWELTRKLGLPDLPAGTPAAVLVFREGGRITGSRVGEVEGVRLLAEPEKSAPPADSLYTKWITPDMVSILDPGKLWRAKIR
ncbi:MAG: chemotaxis protein CheW [Acidobacteria bacterium]|nr:chemotaxis protein CheW [Acidobacteriota bacterium]